MKKNELIVVVVGLGVWWFFHGRGRNGLVARTASGTALSSAVVGGYEAPVMVGGAVATSAGNAVAANRFL